MPTTGTATQGGRATRGTNAMPTRTEQGVEAGAHPRPEAVHALAAARADGDRPATPLRRRLLGLALLASGAGCTGTGGRAAPTPGVSTPTASYPAPMPAPVSFLTGAAHPPAPSRTASAASPWEAAGASMTISGTEG